MSRAIDVFAVLLMVGASSAFAVGLWALTDQQDFKAVYCLVVGGLSLRASTELLRPKSGGAT